MMRTQTPAQAAAEAAQAAKAAAAAAQAAQAAPPAPPAPPTPGQAVFTTTQLARPMTLADVNALKAKREELSRQLNSAQGRRDDVARELRRSADGPARAGIEQRLGVLDARLAQLEMDIAENGRALAAAPAGLLASSSSRGDRDGFTMANLGPGQITGISIVFILGVLMPMAIAMGRVLVKRGARPKPAPEVLESAARIERMEQAIDTIAVEVERISEGQRFVTNLLARRAEQGALGEAEPLGIPVRAGGQ